MVTTDLQPCWTEVWVFWGPTICDECETWTGHRVGPSPSWRGPCQSCRAGVRTETRAPSGCLQSWEPVGVNAPHTRYQKCCEGNDVFR